MFIIFVRVIYLKTLIGIFYIVIIPHLSEIYLFIYLICLFYLFIYFIVLFIWIKYVVYRKEQSKIKGKSREKIGREYD